MIHSLGIEVVRLPGKINKIMVIMKGRSLHTNQMRMFAKLHDLLIIEKQGCHTHIVI